VSVRSDGRAQRSPAELAAIDEAILTAVATDPPMTVRQVFYQLVVRPGFPFEKTRSNADVVQRRVQKLREDGDLDFDDIVDSTRNVQRPYTFPSLAAYRNRVARSYRRELWTGDVRVQVWCEKRALARLFEEITDPLDVPFAAMGGSPSWSLIHEAAKLIDRPTFVYYFGDHDATGVDIVRDVEARLRQRVDGIGDVVADDVKFIHAALNPEQIARYKLETKLPNPKDTRSKKFKGPAAELDALPMVTLRALIRGCIERHVDPIAVAAIRAEENRERDELTDA